MTLTAGPDDIPGTYARVAEDWDRARNRNLFERPWLDRLVSGLKRGAQVLDLGCGAGEPIARWLIEAGFDVTGVDVAEPMLAIARARLPEGTWIRADMREMDLGRQFDAILAFNSSFHLSSQAQRALFPVFSRHLKPGGRLVFTCGPQAGEVMGAVAGEPVYHASLSVGEYAMLMEENGLMPREYVAEDPECAGHTLWLAERRG